MSEELSVATKAAYFNITYLQIPSSCSDFGDKTKFSALSNHLRSQSSTDIASTHPSIIHISGYSPGGSVPSHSCLHSLQKPRKTSQAVAIGRTPAMQDAMPGV